MRKRTNQDGSAAAVPVHDYTLEEIVNSQSFLHELSMIRRQKVKIDNVVMDVDKIDLDHLAREQARDLKEIELLQEQIKAMSANLSVHGVDVPDLKLKPDLGYAEGSSEYMKALRQEIAKYQKKIELLEVKGQFEEQMSFY